MTRLTKDIRTSIANRATEAAFKSRIADHKKAENTLGMQLFRHVFDEKTLKAVAKVPTAWFRQDCCLRFNCAGYDLTFRLDKPVSAPYSGGGFCSRLGTVTGELAERAQKHAQDGEKLTKERNAAYEAVMTMLNSVSSIAQLEKAWPEGKEFYSMYAEAREGSNLPAIKVAEINKMLGLAEAA